MPAEVQPRLAPPRACAWCGAPLEQGAGARRGRLECASCGAATTAPWPTEAELDAAYAAYRPASGRFSAPGDVVLARLRAAFARRVDRLAPPGGVLDVGSGDGTLLRALAARGRECTGVEREPAPGVVAADVRELEGPWAAVVFWHSLEHLREPGAVFEHVARRLEPEGIMFVAAPNYASLQARAFGDRWFALDLPRHLVHLPLPAVVARARALGLRPRRISHLRGGQSVFGWLHGLVGSLPGRPDLYDAIRRPQARSRRLSPGRRAAALAAGVLLLPPAALLALGETAARRGGSFYVELERS